MSRRPTKPDKNAELEEEIRSHLQEAIRERLERGESLQEAESAARREFGNVELVKETARDAWGTRAFEELSRDFQYGFRQLRRSPGFAILATLTLAIGIGANTAIFSVVDFILFRPLPYEEPDRLALVWTRLDNAGIPRNGVSPPELMDLFGHDAFESLSAFYDSSASLTTTERPERVATVFVSTGLFSMLRAEPAIGRGFLPQEGEPGRDRVAVLSHGLWRRRFGGRPDVVGTEMRLDGERHSIVGIMPERFRSPLGEADLWLPLAFRPEELSEDERGSHYLDVIVRLKQDLSLVQAQASLDALAARLDRDHPESYRDAGFGIGLGLLHEELVAGSRKPLLLLLGAVGFVLLTACANVANLLLFRASERRREMALRAALGAGRRRLSQQLLGESLTLAAIGGILGILLAIGGVDLLRALGPADLPRLGDVAVDRSILGWALLLTGATGVAFGLVPALFDNVPQGLKDGSPNATVGRQRASLRGALVVLETAVAMVLLVGASLLLRSLLSLGQVNPGLEPQELLTLRLSLPAARYPDQPRSREFRETLLQRIEALPGVKRAAATSHLPLGGLSMSRNFTIEGPSALSKGLSELELQSYLVSPGYFETMGIPRIRGEDFSTADTADSPFQVIIDERLAEKLWPGEDPIGRRLRTGGLQSEPSPWRVVAGTVGYVRHHRLDLEGREQLYFPFSQLPAPYTRSFFVTVKTEGDPQLLAPTVEKVIHGLDPELAVFDVKPMEFRVHSSLSQPRFRAGLLALFAATAVLLASIGVYGVLAFAVEQRRRETGLRMAMGARPGQIFRLVLRDGLAFTLLGIALGLAGAIGLSSVLETLLFGVRPLDGVTFAIAPALLMLVALAAISVPARRAMRVDPMVALRYE
jgi:predicted permease